MWQRRLGVILPAVGFGILFLLLWQWFVIARDIKPYLLPKPSDIWHQISLNQTEIVKAARNTGTNALVGLICGSVAGVAMAFLASRFRIFSEMVTPLAAAINAMPIIALAPMFNNIFSTTSSIPRRLVVTIVVFFPIFINTFRGLTRIDPIHDELMRSYAASEADVFRRVRIPSALPFIFAGLKLATVLCMIGAIVGDYFGGSLNALGVQIQNSISLFDFPLGWAAVVVASAFGIGFYALVALAERLSVRGARSTRGRE